jgi:cytochrome P450
MTQASELAHGLRSLPSPPVLKGHWLLGTTPESAAGPFEFLNRAWAERGDIVKLAAVRPFYWYLVTHPAAVERILRTHQTNYRKPKMFTRQFSLLSGNGLLTSEGDFWRRQRRLAQPAFHRQRLVLLAGTMAKATLGMVERWAATHAQTHQPFDMAEEMTALTVAIAAETLFGADISGNRVRFGEALRIALEHVTHRMRYPTAPQFIPTARNRRFGRARRTLDEIVYKLIEARRSDPTDRGDLLSMLMLARDEETGQAMDDRQLRDEVMTALIAGHETSAAALVWAWYLLAQNDGPRARLRGEVSAALRGRAPTVEDLSRLPYARMVMDETLRLYPPAWGQPRQVIAADELCGYRVEAGKILMVSQYITHRHPDYWERPEEFMPERFTPEAIASRPRFTYFPFGGGAHHCIGNNFALMETQLVLSTVIQHFEPRLAPGARAELDTTFTLRPRNGLLMQL